MTDLPSARPLLDRVRPAPLVLLLVVWWILVAALVPVIQDEAYYVAWARHLALGYLDHPPLVAVFTALSRWFPGSALAARCGAIAASVAGAIATIHLGRVCGLRSNATIVALLVIRFTGFLGLGLGFLTTPDSPLFLAWTLAMLEAAAALRGARWRWLTAGIATGLGLWGKYTTVLIGPVFLWGLVRGDRAALRTPWPYLGGVLALLVWSPQLAWNARHDWQTVSFQLKHGFSGTHSIESDEIDVVPRAQPPQPEGPEAELAARFPLPPTAYHAKPPSFRAARKVSGRLREYVLGEIGLMGFLLLPFVVLGIERLRARARRGSTAPPTAISCARERCDPRVEPLLMAGWIVPLGFFFVATFPSRTELNWPAMYVVSASVLLAPFVAGRLARWLVVGSLVNVACTTLVALHARHPFLPFPTVQDRVLRETRGFDRVAARLRELPEPMFASTYQLTSMTRFYGGDRPIGQWPGASRPSELTLRGVQAPYTWDDVVKAGSFWMLSWHASIDHVPGAQATDLVEIRDCRDPKAPPLVERRASALSPDDAPPCEPIHLWYLARYQVPPPTEP